MTDRAAARVEAQDRDRDPAPTGDGSAEPAPWREWADAEPDLLDGHDAVLLDLDGVVYVGEHAVPGAVEGVAAARDRDVPVAFVTNNAARTPEAVAEHLTGLGVRARADDVVTSAQAAAALLRDELPPGAPVLVVGAEGLTRAVAEAGLRPVTSTDDGPRAVVQGFSPATDWSMLLEACVAVRSGLPWVATNTDPTLPTPRGPAPGNGAFVDVVRRTTGVEPRVAGKPFRPLMDASVARLGARRPVFVGDRLDTDLAGARRAGLAGALVLTGVTDLRRLLVAAPDERPDYLLADLPGLLAPHPAPQRDRDAWSTPACRVRWIAAQTGNSGDASGRVTLEGDPDGGTGTALSAVRAVCAALWCGPGQDRAVPDAVVDQALDALRPWVAGAAWAVP